MIRPRDFRWDDEDIVRAEDGRIFRRVEGARPGRFIYVPTTEAEIQRQREVAEDIVTAILLKRALRS